MDFFDKIKDFTVYIGGSTSNDIYPTCFQIFSRRFETPFFCNHCNMNEEKFSRKTRLREYGG